MLIPTKNLDVKRAQLNELRLIEAHRRATVVKAYEVIKVENIQLPAPEQLAVSIRKRKGGMWWPTATTTFTAFIAVERFLDLREYKVLPLQV